jgi:apoptotic chromatin condensation inducer in the nucleus
MWALEYVRHYRKADLIELLQNYLSTTADSSSGDTESKTELTEAVEQTSDKPTGVKRRAESAPEAAEEPQTKAARKESDSAPDGSERVADDHTGDTGAVNDTTESQNDTDAKMDGADNDATAAGAKDVLRIDGFKRPLTVAATKRLLGSFGNVVDFWMDAIKSHCFVVYDSEDSAAKALADLDGRQWPEQSAGRLQPVYSSRTALVCLMMLLVHVVRCHGRCFA